MRSKIISFIICIALFAGACLSGRQAISIAMAISNGDIAITPAKASDPNDSRTKSWFIYELGPGDSVNDTVLIKNESFEKRTVQLYAADAYTTAQGGFALRNDEDPKEHVGNWVSFQKTIVTLEPKQEEIVSFTYTVAKNAEPGEYAGGIVAEDTKPIKGEGISVVKRVGARIYHTVPGERREKLTLIGTEMKEREGMRWQEAKVQNVGNVTLEIVLKEEVSDRTENSIAKLESQPFTLLPGSTISMMPSAWKQPWLGKFSIEGAVYNVKTGKELVALPMQEFLVFHPILIAAGIAALALILFTLGLFLRRKTKK